MAGYVLGITMMVIIIIIGAGSSWLHLQEVSSFFSGLGEREKGIQSQTRLLCGILTYKGSEVLDAGLGSSFHQVALDKPSSLVPSPSPRKPGG